jgi:hypothetical protein
VRDAEASGLAEANTVDDRGVVELVRVETVRLLQDCREEPFVCVPTGHVEDRVFGPEEGSDLGLELFVQLLRAADETYGGQARTPTVDRLLLRLTDPRVIGKAQIVVRGQHDDLATVDLHARVLGGLQDELLLEGPRLLELRHFAREVIDEAHVGKVISYR